MGHRGSTSIEDRMPARAVGHRGSTSIEDRIIAIASGQHGLITRAQLLETGLTADAVDARVRYRRLRLVHRGVYIMGTLVGPLIPPRSREMAAVLVCGPGAVVSHASAACLWDLLPPEPAGSPVHVTIPGRDRGRRAGILPHRVPTIDAAEVAAVDGVPVTTPARTLLDLAGRIRARELEQAIALAERRELIEVEQVTRLLDRCGPRRGVGVLRKLVCGQQRPALARSVAEERFLTLVRTAKLPAPESNVRIGGYEVDFLWRSESVAVEVDGFAYHSSRRSFESDRRRDAHLAARGIHVVRLTWRQITDESVAVLVRLAQILVRSEHRGSPLVGPDSRALNP